MNNGHHNPPQIDRREFIRRTAAGASAALLPWGCARAEEPARPGGRSRVAVAHDEGVWDGDILSRSRYAEMLDRSIRAATGRDDARDAWRSVFGPRDTIGIKVNCLAGPRLSTPAAGALALADCLGDAGFEPQRIVIFERTVRELRRAGYESNRGGAEVQCVATDEFPGRGYEPEPTVAGDVGSCLSQVLTRRCTALVSFGVVKDHDLSGISVCMKNLFGVIHNPNKYHDNQCDPYIADVLTLPPVRSKFRLAIADATLAQCHGGPAYRPDFAWNANRVFVSADPVALDAVAGRMIEDERRRRGLPSLEEAGRPPKWLSTAAARNLGHSDAERIDTIEA